VRAIRSGDTDRMNALMGLFWLLAGLLGGGDDDPECLVLGGLDAVRTQAFVFGREPRLRGVYVDVHAARPDVDVLRSYRERGLRLGGMVLVRESCRVTDRSRGSVTLDVVDHLGPTWAVTEDGRRRDLPRDRSTRRTVVLDWTEDGWRVARVESGERRLER
jgi:hypothetical protein